MSEPFELYTNESKSIQISEIAADYDNKQIFWIEQDSDDDFKTRIRYVSLNGGESKMFEITGSSNSDRIDQNLLAVDEKYVYFVKNGTLLRAGKSDGASDEDFGIINDNPKDRQFPISRFKYITILSKNPQKIVDNGEEDIATVERQELLENM